MALAAAKTAAKISLVGGAIYWSLKQGIWGTTTEGSDAGKRLTKVIAPTASEYVEKIPSVKDVNVSVKTNWNTGMKSLFHAVSELPATAGEYTEMAKSAITESSRD